MTRGVSRLGSEVWATQVGFMAAATTEEAVRTAHPIWPTEQLCGALAQIFATPTLSSRPLLWLRLSRG
jgi:hypothetical protein